MNIKLTINGVEKDIKINKIAQTYRDEYFKKVALVDKMNADDSISMEEKVEKSKEFIKWLEKLAQKKANLSEEEIKYLEEDVEEKDELTNYVREVLQPLKDKKKS